MSRSSAVTFFVFIVIGVFLSTGCSVVDGVFGGDDTYVVQVDSVEVPATVQSTDTLSIQLFGTIGPDGCHRFKRFEASKTDSSLDLKVIGEETGGGCTDMIVPLDREYQVHPPFEDPFRIRIEQPNGSVLKRTVEVTES